MDSCYSLLFQLPPHRVPRPRWSCLVSQMGRAIALINRDRRTGSQVLDEHANEPCAKLTCPLFVEAKVCIQILEPQCDTFISCSPCIGVMEKYRDGSARMILFSRRTFGRVEKSLLYHAEECAIGKFDFLVEIIQCRGCWSFRTNDGFPNGFEAITKLFKCWMKRGWRTRKQGRRRSGKHTVETSSVRMT